MANRFVRRLKHNFTTLHDKPFVTMIDAGGEATLSWRDLEHGCGAWAAAYAAAGIDPGGQVLIFLRHSPSLYAAFFGAMLTGITPSFMPCSSPRQDPNIYWRSHDELIRHIRPAGIVADAATFSEMSEAGLDLGAARLVRLEDVGAAADLRVTDDLAEDAIGLLQHSSGTTGLKKGVALSFQAIVDQVESYADTISLGRNDRIVSWLPLYHDMGLIACCITPAYTGTPIVHIDPFHWLVKPGLLLECMEGSPADQGGAFTWLPNFAFDHLAAICGRTADRFDLSRARAFINCSEPCKPHSFDRFLEAFGKSGVRPDQLQCCYAMAESVFAVTQTRIGEAPHRMTVAPSSLDRGARPTAAADGPGVELVECGTVIPGIEVAILDETGQRAEPGVVGEIGLSGRFMFSGYNRDPERTAQRMSGGLYRTNDLGFLDEAGRLYVLGRLDDLIIINGRNLYAHEIEAIVGKVPGVKAGRAVAMSEFSERVGSETLLIAAEQRKGDDRARADIQRDIQAAIHSVFAVVPHRIEVVDEGRLVKTTSGKISRKENLARFGAAQQG